MEIKSNDKLIELAYQILLESGKIKSVFDIPSYRSTIDPSHEKYIPNRYTNISTNQTTKTDFDYYYDLNKSITSGSLVDKVVQYQQERDFFEFQPLYKKLVQAAINDKIILSDLTEKDLIALRAEVHTKNKDNALEGQISTDPIDLNLIGSTDGVMVKINVNGNVVGSIIKDSNVGTLLSGIKIDWNDIINKETFTKDEINDLLNEKVDKNDLFNKDGSIKQDIIDKIFTQEPSPFIDHINDKVSHITEDERNNWNAKYDKPINGIPFNDLEQVVKDILNNSKNHMNDKVSHITSSERTEWNNKITRPVDGFDESWLHQSILNKINNAITNDEVFDSEGMFREDKLSINTDNFLDITEFNKHIEEFNAHSQSKIHITTAERAKWDSMYLKPSTGIPESDLSEYVQDKITNALTWELILDPSTIGTANKKIDSKLLPSEDNLKAHTSNKSVHVTLEDKELWNDRRFYNGIDTNILPIDNTDPNNNNNPNPTRSIDINHLPYKVREMSAGSLTIGELNRIDNRADNEIRIPMFKIDALINSLKELFKHAGIDNPLNSEGDLDINPDLMLKAGNHMKPEDRTNLNKLLNLLDGDKIKNDALKIIAATGKIDNKYLDLFGIDGKIRAEFLPEPAVATYKSILKNKSSNDPEYGLPIDIINDKYATSADIQCILDEL